MNRTKPMTLPIANLREAAWNTHRAKENDVEAFNGLVASIKANGMMHRVVVRKTADGETAAKPYEIIDGHRRVEAAKAAGWDEVPCEVIEGLSDEDAQAMTATANIQRLDNDPLLEAELIERLAGADKTYEQIAAILGKDVRYVARRARLCNLTERWRDWFGRCEAGADIMETVAAHEQDLQDEAFDTLQIADEDGVVDEEDIEQCLGNLMRKIDKDTPFDIGVCAACQYNTATHGWLFPLEEDCKGRCQKPECFKKNWNEAVDKQIAALKRKKVEIGEVTRKYDIPNYWSSKPKKDKTHTKPWIYTEDGMKHLRWAEPPAAPIRTAPAKTEAEKKAERKAKAKYKAWKEAREHIASSVRAFASMEDGAGVRKMVEQVADKPEFREWAIGKLAHPAWWTDDAVADLARLVGRERIEQICPGAEYNALFEPDPRLAAQGDDENN